MKVAATGGAGFLGSHVAGALAAAGNEVRAFDSLDPSYSVETKLANVRCN